MTGFWLLVIVCAFCALIGGVLLFIENKSRFIFPDWLIVASFLAVGIGLFLAFLFTLLAVHFGKQAEKEYLAFEYTRQAVEQAYECGDWMNNYAVTNSLVEVNKWLADAKADKETYGIFSLYYSLNLDEVEFITIPYTPEWE